MVGIDRGEAGARWRVDAARTGSAPDRDSAIGFQRGECRAGGRHADEVVAAGERIIADKRGAPGGDGAIGAQRRKGVGVGIDSGIAVVGGRAGAAPSAVSPGGDRAVRLQRRESAGIRGDGHIAAAGGRVRAACGVVTPGDQAAIGLHGHHGTAIGEDLRVAGSGGFAGATANVLAPGDDAAIGLHRRKGCAVGEEAGVAQIGGCPHPALIGITPRRDGAVITQGGEGGTGLGDLHITSRGRHAGGQGAAAGAVAPGDDRAIGSEGGIGAQVDALAASSTGRQGRILAYVLVGGVGTHLDGVGLRCDALAVAGGQGELVGAGCGGGTGHCAVGLQRHAGGQGAGNVRVGGRSRNRAQVVAGDFADGVVGVADRLGWVESGRRGVVASHHRQGIGLARLAGAVVGGDGEVGGAALGGRAFQIAGGHIEAESVRQTAGGDGTAQAEAIVGAHLVGRRAVHPQGLGGQRGAGSGGGQVAGEAEFAGGHHRGGVGDGCQRHLARPAFAATICATPGSDSAIGPLGGEGVSVAEDPGVAGVGGGAAAALKTVTPGGDAAIGLKGSKRTYIAGDGCVTRAGRWVGAAVRSASPRHD